MTIDIEIPQEVIDGLRSSASPLWLAVDRVYRYSRDHTASGKGDNTKSARLVLTYASELAGIVDDIIYGRRDELGYPIQ